MKRTKIMFVCALVLALAGVTTLRSAEEGVKEGKAKIAAMSGKVEFVDTTGALLPCKVGMRFAPGITIKTGADGSADLQVNGTASVIRMKPNTVLQIPKMTFIGDPRDGDNETMLNLETGSIVGNIKKISKASLYEIETPHGVAGIRGTDVGADVIPQPNGQITVTFKSITGVITVAAVINGTTVTHTLTTGTQWTIGENPEQIAADLLQALQLEIASLLYDIEHGFGGPGPGHPGGGPPIIIPPIHFPGSPGPFFPPHGPPAS